MRLSKDDILKAPGPATEIVSVPEWNGEVAVRGMTGRERDEFEASSVSRRGDEVVPNTANIRARVVVRCVIDEDTGERLFADADAQELGNKSASAVTRVAEVALRLSGLADDDVKELEENFGSPPTTAATVRGAGSSSPSSANSAGGRSKDSSTRSAAGN